MPVCLCMLSKKLRTNVTGLYLMEISDEGFSILGIKVEEKVVIELLHFVPSLPAGV